MSLKNSITSALVFLVGSVCLLPLNTFAGALSDISISSTTNVSGNKATYTISYTTESELNDGFGANRIITMVLSNLDELGFFANTNFTFPDVSVTIDGEPVTLLSFGYGAISLDIRVLESSIPAGSDIVITIRNFTNAAPGTYTFDQFFTSDDPVDTGVPDSIVIVADTFGPDLSQEEGSIETHTNDTTPSFTFTSNEEGTITYGGGCSSETTEAVEGENTIVFDELEEGTYNDCTITVEDTHENTSDLEVPTFTVDTTEPVLTVLQTIPERTNGGLEYKFTSSEACDFLAEHPSSTLGEVEAIISPTGEENTFSARVNGAQRGGTYSFSFLCRDQAHNVSNMLTVGPFTVTGGGGGSVSTEEVPVSGETPAEVIVKGPPVSIPTEPETPKTEETPAVVPEKVKYVFSVDITPRRKNSEKDVRALQTFFNQYEGEKLAVTGVYDAETIAAVNRFQRKYAGEILAPWGIDYATGNVGIYTRKKIQEMMNS